SNSGNSVIKHTANAGYLVLHSDNFDLRPKSNGGHVYLRANYNDGVDLYFANSKKFETTNTGITVTGTVVATGADINGDLDVDGHTNLDNVSISGVTTFAGNVDINADIDVDGHTNLDNVSIVGVTTHQGHVLPSADVTYDLGSSSKQWRNLYADNIVSAPGNGFIGPDLTVRNFKATGIST
ncbi:MAG: hypothetical protein VXY93_20980, partial [Pseudomonadota bacterium]|nr:hypothetical protein [Pseudomonadota bacterium]